MCANQTITASTAVTEGQAADSTFENPKTLASRGRWQREVAEEVAECPDDACMITDCCEMHGHGEEVAYTSWRLRRGGGRRQVQAGTTATGWGRQSTSRAMASRGGAEGRLTLERLQQQMLMRLIHA